MRKRLILATVGVTVIACMLGSLSMLYPSPAGITNANLCRIEKGMTLFDVEQIFGERGIQLDGGKVFWKAEDEFAVIVLFKDDRVHETYWNDSKQTTVGKLLVYLHLR